MQVICGAIDRDLNRVESLIRQNLTDLRLVSRQVEDLETQFGDPIVTSDFKLFKDDLRFFKGLMKNRLPGQSSAKKTRHEHGENPFDIDNSKISIVDANFSNDHLPAFRFESPPRQGSTKKLKIKGRSSRKKEPGPDISQFLEDKYNPQPPRILQTTFIKNEDNAAPTAAFLEKLNEVMVADSFKLFQEEDLGVNIFPKVKCTKAQQLRDRAKKQKLEEERSKRLEEVTIQMKLELSNASSANTSLSSLTKERRRSRAFSVTSSSESADLKPKKLKSKGGLNSRSASTSSEGSRRSSGVQTNIQKTTLNSKGKGKNTKPKKSDPKITKIETIVTSPKKKDKVVKPSPTPDSKSNIVKKISDPKQGTTPGPTPSMDPREEPRVPTVIPLPPDEAPPKKKTPQKKIKPTAEPKVDKPKMTKEKDAPPKRNTTPKPNPLPKVPSSDIKAKPTPQKKTPTTEKVVLKNKVSETSQNRTRTPEKVSKNIDNPRTKETPKPAKVIESKQSPAPVKKDRPVSRPPSQVDPKVNKDSGKKEAKPAPVRTESTVKKPSAEPKPKEAISKAVERPSPPPQVSTMPKPAERPPSPSPLPSKPEPPKSDGESPKLKEATPAVVTATPPPPKIESKDQVKESSAGVSGEDPITEVIASLNEGCFKIMASPKPTLFSNIIQATPPDSLNIEVDTQMEEDKPVDDKTVPVENPPVFEGGPSNDKQEPKKDDQAGEEAPEVKDGEQAVEDEEFVFDDEDDGVNG